MNQEILQQLVNVCREEPAKAAANLVVFNDGFSSDPLWRSVRGGLFIDVGAALRDETLIQQGLEYELAALSITNPEHLSSRWYNIGNGHAALHKVRTFNPNFRFDPDSTPLIEAKRCYHMALSRIDKEANHSVQLLVNYGNCLSALGRSLEAIEIFRRALALESSHPMALGNLGIGLSNFASIARDPMVLEEAERNLQAALSSSAQGKLEGPEAKIRFENELSRIREFFAKYPHVRSISQETPTPIECRYLDFCRSHNLFLSLRKSTEFDSVGLSLITPFDDITTFPRLVRVINEVKERFAVARLLAWQASAATPIADGEDLTDYADLMDSSVYGMRPAKLKIAFETAFNVLDKIAFFMNEHLRLGLAEDKITFFSIWKAKNGELRQALKSRGSFHIFGLYDVQRDMSKDGYLGSIRLRRNISTHRYLVAHEASQDSWKIELDSQIYHIGYRELFEKTLELLKLVRCAVIYLVAFVDQEERQKKSGDSVFCPVIVPSHKSKNKKPSDSSV